MRRVGIMDLHHAARAIAAVPPEQRVEFAAMLCWRAQVADKYVKRFRRCHPRWGDGSLRSVAMAHPQVAPGIPVNMLMDEYYDILQCINSETRKNNDAEIHPEVCVCVHDAK